MPLPCLRGGGIEGFNSLASAGMDSVCRVFDRRGGGKAGLALSSSSNSSFADLNDPGEDGALLSSDVETRLLKVAERLGSCGFGRSCSDVVGTVAALVLRAANCIGFCLTGGDLDKAFCIWADNEREDSLVPSVNCGRGTSTEGFDLGTGGGVCVFFLTREALSLGSGGSVKLRRGLGDLTEACEFLTTTGDVGGGCVGVTGRFCSNILTRELVGGIGLSSVDLSCTAVTATDCDLKLPSLLLG